MNDFFLVDEDPLALALFDMSSMISVLAGIEFCAALSIGFGSGLTNEDKLQFVKLSITGSFLDPSSLEVSIELDASEPLSDELSLSFSLFEECLI